jgi:hypothetical protein
MAWRPQAAGPKSIRSLYHWIWTQLTDLGVIAGGGLPEGPVDPGEPIPPQPPGAHNHYLENLIDVGIPSKEHRNSLSYEESTGFWEADSRSKTFFEEFAPADNESSAGDLWVVTDIP